MQITNKFNSFYHSAVLADLYKKSSSLQIRNLIDTRTGGVLRITKYEDYQDMDDLKQLLKLFNLDYAVDESKDDKVSTKDIDNKALLQHIEYCIQVGINSAVELDFVRDEWDRLIQECNR